MNDFFVDLLPKDAALLARQRTRFRTLLLTAALATTTVVGLSAHSFVASRNAAMSHSVASDLSRNIKDLTEMVAPLRREREQLGREMTAARGLRMPIETSDVLATVTHLLPDGTQLTNFSCQLAPIANPAYASTPGASRASKNKTPEVDSISPTIFVLQCELRGSAVDSRSLEQLVSYLTRTTAFAEVNVVDNRTAPSGAIGAREFTIKFSADPWASSRSERRSLAQLSSNRRTP